MNLNQLATNTLRLARVTHVHPEGQKMEVVYLDTGDHGRDVQLMSPYAGSDFGFTSGIPSPEEEGHDANMSDDPDRRTILAVVAHVQGHAFALGFVYPQISQMAFTKERDKDRLIERHTSDFYRTIDQYANMHMVHPAGAYFSISQDASGYSDDPSPQSLAGRDFDGKWAIRRNTDRAATVALSSGNATLTMTSSGAVKLKAKTVEITAERVVINADVQINGDATVSGDVVASNVSLVTHRHRGVTVGSALTQEPVPGG